MEERKEGIYYNLTCYAYDKAGNRIQEKRSQTAVKKGSEPSQWLIFTFTYDRRNRLVKAEDSLVASTTDGNGNTIQYHFNSMNKLEEIVDQNGEKDTFTYDSQGRMASHTDRNHVKTTYGYNMDNQLRFKRAEMLEDTSIQAGRNNKRVAGQENKYSYNSLGQLTEASGGGVVYSYTYTLSGNVADKLVNGSKALSYTYTASGKVAGITDKSGKKTTYQYDKAGRVASVSDNGNVVAEYSYYEDGKLWHVKFANGVETNYIYNADKNYSNIVTKTAAGEILLDYSYAYDGNGNRTKKVGSDCVKKIEGNDSSIGATTYEYDSLQRLQKVSYPTGKVEQFQYDNAGNRALKKYGTAENFKTGNYLEERYQYDNRNRLLERRNAQDVTYYQYDKQGNTVSELTKRFLKSETTKVQNGRSTTITSGMAQTEVEQYKTYEYDSFNKVAKVVVENYTNGTKEIHTQKNFYDAENMRYGIEESGSQTNFVTNGWSVFTELDKDWNVRNRLIRGYGIVASEEVEENVSIDKTNVDSYHFYHQNEHGDTEYITGQNCEIKNAYTYDAFGNITNSTELVKNRYTYNGEQYDTTTNQYYLRARYYNPLAGRFTQEDVYRGDGLNLYAYCGNNPVMYVDPSGYVTYTDRTIEVEGTDIGSANYKTGDYLDIMLSTSTNSRATEVTITSDVSDQIYKDFSKNSNAWERGKTIENTIAYANSGDYVQIGNGFDGKFPVIDLANAQSVVSIKSLNQFCPSYKIDGNPDVNLVADQIMKYYNAIDDVKISVNKKYGVEKSLVVALNGKSSEFKQRVQKEVDARIQKKYMNINEDENVNKKTQCSIA